MSNLVFRSEGERAIMSEQRVGKLFGPEGQEVTGLWKIDAHSLRDEFTQRRSWVLILGNILLPEGCGRERNKGGRQQLGRSEHRWDKGKGKAVPLQA